MHNRSDQLAKNLLRDALEALMQTSRYEFQSDFAKKYVAIGRKEGQDEGRKEGRAEAKAQAVLAVLAARGLDVTM